MLRIQIGDVQFFGEGVKHGPQFLVTPDGFTGWDEGTDVRRDETPIPRGHGDFDAPGDLAPRVISVSGEILADSPAQRAHMGARLTGLLAAGGSAHITVEQDGAIQWANVRLTGRTSVKPLSHDLNSAKFQIQFWAADPRKYGETNQAGPLGYSVAAFHYGNFPAFPIIEVHGYNASGGYTISGPDGKKFIVTQGLFGGDVHRIDMRTGRLTKNGVLQIGAVSRADLWTVPSGTRVGHKISNAASDATTDIRVFTTDTYI